MGLTTLELRAAVREDRCSRGEGEAAWRRRSSSHARVLARRARRVTVCAVTACVPLGFGPRNKRDRDLALLAAWWVVVVRDRGVYVRFVVIVAVIVRVGVRMRVGMRMGVTAIPVLVLRV
jgi:hypothetical protein